MWLFFDMTSLSIFLLLLFFLSSLVTGSSFMSILSLVLELWQFRFTKDWPEIWKLEIHMSLGLIITFQLLKQILWSLGHFFPWKHATYLKLSTQKLFPWSCNSLSYQELTVIYFGALVLSLKLCPHQWLIVFQNNNDNQNFNKPKHQCQLISLIGQTFSL